jgi:hypothetical protein
MDTIDFLNN